MKQIKITEWKYTDQEDQCKTVVSDVCPNVQLVAIYEILKDEEKRQMYNRVLVDGLPDWRTPVFYYRRARKMGFVELFALLALIITVGQYLFGWAVYIEQRLTLVSNLYEGQCVPGSGLHWSVAHQCLSGGQVNVNQQIMIVALLTKSILSLTAKGVEVFGGAGCHSSDLYCHCPKVRGQGCKCRLTALQWVMYEKTLECLKFHSDSGPTSTEVFYWSCKMQCAHPCGWVTALQKWLLFLVLLLPVAVVWPVCMISLLQLIISQLNPGKQYCGQLYNAAVVSAVCSKC